MLREGRREGWEGLMLREGGREGQQEGGGAEVSKSRSFHPENDYVVTSEFLIRII